MNRLTLSNLHDIEAGAKGLLRGHGGRRFAHPDDTLLLVTEIHHLRSEVDRLLRGDFTEPEFQNLCHNMSTEDRARFEQGCIDYQNKLFGSKK